MIAGRAWQDWAFSLGNLVLCVGLVPAIFDPQKPPATSALMIVPVLALFGVAEWTLNLKASAISTVMQIVLWVTLGVQRLAQ